MAARWQPAHRATPSQRSWLYDPLAFPFRSAPFQPLPSAEQRDGRGGRRAQGACARCGAWRGKPVASLPLLRGPPPGTQPIKASACAPSPPPCSLLPPDLPSPFPAPSSLVTMEHKMAAWESEAEPGRDAAAAEPARPRRRVGGRKKRETGRNDAAASGAVRGGAAAADRLWAGGWAGRGAAGRRPRGAGRPVGSSGNRARPPPEGRCFPLPREAAALPIRWITTPIVPGRRGCQPPRPSLRSKGGPPLPRFGGCGERRPNWASARPGPGLALPPQARASPLSPVIAAPASVGTPSPPRLDAKESGFLVSSEPRREGRVASDVSWLLVERHGSGRKPPPQPLSVRQAKCVPFRFSFRPSPPTFSWGGFFSLGINHYYSGVSIGCSRGRKGGAGPAFFPSWVIPSEGQGY